MTKISRIPVEKKKMDQFYNDFWDAVASLGTREEAKNFLFDLLTHTERRMLAKRFQITVMLLEGQDYQTIKSQIKVSGGTIAKVNNWLNTGATSLIRIAERIAEPKKDHREGKQRGKYLAGNLLFPAIEEGVRLASRRLKKRR